MRAFRVHLSKLKQNFNKIDIFFIDKNLYSKGRIRRKIKGRAR